jgi:hypothetical protein
MAVLTAVMYKGGDLIPGQIKFNSTIYPAPYGYSSYTCTIGEQVYVDGMPSDTSLTAPNDPRVVAVIYSVQYTSFYYS